VERTVGLFWGGRWLPAKNLWRTLTRVLMAISAPSRGGRGRLLASVTVHVDGA
jgi:hypothetical protein